ncbi:hypothetical protein [Spongiimicrobium sp. 2-473A-2-J]|uniref:hypothetical protein n=1 Tax=Eudoraea algarum TaxID=3417568 RepID=UPI003D36E5F1
MKKIRQYALCLLTLLLIVTGCAQKKRLHFCGSAENDLYQLLIAEKFNVHRYDTPEAAVANAPKGSGVIIAADAYPEERTVVPHSVYEMAAQKKVRLYMEYPQSVPGLEISGKRHHATLERGVVSSTVFGEALKPMELLGMHACTVLEAKAENPLMVLAKVAGFDRAEYGIDDVHTYPLLVQRDHVMAAMTKLTNFRSARYGPQASWKKVWEYILSWLSADTVQLKTWPSDVTPMYARNQPMPKDALQKSVAKGVDWFYKGRFFIHPEGRERWSQYQGDGVTPFGPPMPREMPNGDGSLGILEGHASKVSKDGSQQYRYWIRADVQGEAAHALAAGGNLLGKPEYLDQAKKLVDFIYSSGLGKTDPESPVFGLISWSLTHPNVHYGDDNARAILGVIGAAAYLGTEAWNKEIAANILSNFRLSGIQGFQEGRLDHMAISEKGWQHFAKRDFVNPHPHFESWMWACYLWLYDKTGYRPLLEKAKIAIRLTMEAYPEQWKWTNGIQQERARMLLPLAWLVRVEDTAEHREWLDRMVAKLLDNQQPSGAIREELGAGHSGFGRTTSNATYGTTEAPLIFENGDSVADMLYTSNFAFFGLNEAAHATGNPRYHRALKKLSDFLTRIQVDSKAHPDLDGAWFRAFDYGRWDYWASNADHGWGAWCTLTGWIQSWIVATQVLVADQNSYWELTRDANTTGEMGKLIKPMMGKGKNGQER